jgi:hypothetical protein
MPPTTSAAPASRVLLPQSNSGNQLHDASAPMTAVPGSTLIKGVATANMTKSSSKENIPTSPKMTTSASANKIRALAEAKTAGSTPPALSPGRWQGQLQHPQQSAVGKSPSSGDVDPDESRSSWRSWKRGEGLQSWELDIVNQPDVRRKANVAQLCENIHRSFRQSAADATLLSLKTS